MHLFLDLVNFAAPRVTYTRFRLDFNTRNEISPRSEIFVFCRVVVYRFFYTRNVIYILCSLRSLFLLFCALRGFPKLFLVLFDSLDFGFFSLLMMMKLISSRIETESSSISGLSFTFLAKTLSINFYFFVFRTRSFDWWPEFEFLSVVPYQSFGAGYKQTSCLGKNRARIRTKIETHAHRLSCGIWLASVHSQSREQPESERKHSSTNTSKRFSRA